MAGILRLYLRALERHPWKTQAASTGILMAAGDVISQFAIERSSISEFNPKRTTRFLIFGTVLAGPALRGWYLTLEKIVKTTGPRAALTKVAFDQLAFAPAFCAFFLGTMGYWRSKSIEAAKDMLKETYVDVLIANYKLWPAAQIINFYFVPFQHRVLYVNFVALIWNTYLAWKAEQQRVEEHESVKGIKT